MLLQPNGPAHSRLRGGLVNNDGKGKAAFQHPSGASQADLLTDVWKQFQVQRIDHIECHGTGTLLGDPIEVAGLSSAVERFESLRGSSYHHWLGEEQSWPYGSSRWSCGLCQDLPGFEASPDSSIFTLPNTEPGAEIGEFPGCSAGTPILSV